MLLQRVKNSHSREMEYNSFRIIELVHVCLKQTTTDECHRGDIFYEYNTCNLTVISASCMPMSEGLVITLSISLSL